MNISPLSDLYKIHHRSSFIYICSIQEDTWISIVSKWHQVLLLSVSYHGYLSRCFRNIYGVLLFIGRNVWKCQYLHPIKRWQEISGCGNSIEEMLVNGCELSDDSISITAVMSLLNSTSSYQSSCRVVFHKLHKTLPHQGALSSLNCSVAHCQVVLWFTR